MQRYKVRFEEKSYAYGEVYANSPEEALDKIMEEINEANATPLCEEDPEVSVEIYSDDGDFLINDIVAQ